MPEFNPENPRDIERLHRAKKSAWETMAPFRKMRNVLVEATAGHHYASKRKNLRSVREPVNLLDQWVNILLRTFVQQRPTMRVTYPPNPRQAMTFELAGNRWIKENDFKETLSTMVREAVTGYMGIANIGLTPDLQFEHESTLIEVGKPFMDAVLLDDFVWDMQAVRVDQADFTGHRVMRRMEYLIDNPLYDQKVVQSLAQRGMSSSSTDEDDGQDRRDDDALYRRVDIWQIYLPQSGLIVWLSDEEKQKALRWAPWNGPEKGPYRYLWFDKVPGKIMPNSRAAQLLDSHDFVNRIYRDIYTQTRREKEVWAYDGGHEDSAERLRKASHGEFIRADMTALQRVHVGGTNPQKLGVAIHGRQMFDELSANIRSLGGVGPIADTLGQERIAQSSASRMVKDMQGSVVDFTQELFQDISWYLWTETLRPTRVRRPVTEFDSVDDVWPPEILEGDFIEHEIDIEPDSLTYKTSEEQFRALLEIVQTLVIPGMQLPSSRPPVLRLDKLLDMAARRRNIPELTEVVEYASDDTLFTPGKPVSATGPTGVLNEADGRTRPQVNPEEQLVQSLINQSPGSGEEL